MSGISDRKQEIKRRRHRRKKLKKLQSRLKKATFSEKQVIVGKIRNLTPGAEVIIANWGLQEQDSLERAKPCSDLDTGTKRLHC